MEVLVKRNLNYPTLPCFLGKHQSCFKLYCSLDYVVLVISLSRDLYDSFEIQEFLSI